MHLLEIFDQADFIVIAGGVKVGALVGNGDGDVLADIVGSAAVNCGRSLTNFLIPLKVPAPVSTKNWELA
jgi:hypothetical protein